MKDGTVVFNPGRQNPNIVRAAGPIDPEVGLALFRSVKTNEPVGLLTVFALHCDTTGGTQYSADYPYHLQQTLRGRLGGSLHSLFGAGTCGDINHIDVSRAAAPNPQKSEAERIGTALGAKVLATLDALAPQASQLAVRSEAIEVPKQKYSAEDIERAAARIEKVGTRDLTFLEQVEATKIMDLQLYPSDKIALEVQVFRLSDDTAIVCLPGEVFVELGQAIKQASPFKTTFVMELCNDTPAYIPTVKAFAEGSYETVNSRVVSGSGEKMAELALRLLKESKQP
jgi:neutral ceramidase